METTWTVKTTASHHPLHAWPTGSLFMYWAKHGGLYSSLLLFLYELQKRNIWNGVHLMLKDRCLIWWLHIHSFHPSLIWSVWTVGPSFQTFYRLSTATLSFVLEHGLNLNVLTARAFERKSDEARPTYWKWNRPIVYISAPTWQLRDWISSFSDIRQHSWYFLHGSFISSATRVSSFMVQFCPPFFVCLFYEIWPLSTRS